MGPHDFKIFGINLVALVLHRLLQAGLNREIVVGVASQEVFGASGVLWLDCTIVFKADFLNGLPLQIVLFARGRKI